MREPLRLIYMSGTYPSLTMTFIDREIKILRRWGVDLQIVSIRQPPADTPFSQDQRELAQGVTYLIPFKWSRLLFSQLYFILRRPWQYIRTFVYLLTRRHPSFHAWTMTAVHFFEGVYAAFLLRRQTFQELHAHFVDRAATVALVAARLLGKPYSLSIHAGPDIFVDPVLLRAKIMEARHVATCTLYNKSHIESIIGQDLSDKISYIHHGLDLTKYDPAAPSPDGRSLVLSVGQLAERKGFVPLIKACHELKARGYAFECHIVGRGPQRQELEDLITRLSLQDTVVLCGALPHEQVIAKYKQAKMFVLPCIKSRDGNMDGIPNVLPEAMAMQVPVISTDVSAIPELVRDGENGLLVPSANHDALVSAMARLFDTPALCIELGENGRRSVIDTFDVERNVRTFATTMWPDWFHDPGE